MFIYEYTGYGHSKGGPPCEDSIYSDIRAAYNYLSKVLRVPSSSVILCVYISHLTSWRQKQTMFHIEILGASVICRILGQHRDRSLVFVEFFLACHMSSLVEMSLCVCWINWALKMRRSAVSLWIYCHFNWLTCGSRRKRCKHQKHFGSKNNARTFRVKKLIPCEVPSPKPILLRRTILLFTLNRIRSDKN